MSNTRIDVDAKELLKAFASLQPKKQVKVYKDAVRNALRPLQKQTKTNLRKEMGKVANKKDKYGQSLNQGVKMQVYKDGNGGNVNILSNFKLKWFEMGTSERRTRKGYGRGRIKALDFFKNARQTMENEMKKLLDGYIGQAIQNIWRKTK